MALDPKSDPARMGQGRAGFSLCALSCLDKALRLPRGTKIAAGASSTPAGNRCCLKGAAGSQQQEGLGCLLEFSSCQPEH